MDEESLETRLAEMEALHANGDISEAEYRHWLLAQLTEENNPTILGQMSAEFRELVRGWVSRLPRTEEEWSGYRIFRIGATEAGIELVRLQLRAAVKAARDFFGGAGERA